MLSRLDPNQHHLTKNKRGAMHPLSQVSKSFTLFAATAKKPVADMGCAFGNTVLEAIDQGAKLVIACDMNQEHLNITQAQLEERNRDRLNIKLGLFPNGFDFQPNSLSAIHASHIFEYLNGEEAEQAIRNCFEWLEKGGKLFIVTYSIYICELINEKFEVEYQQRLERGVKWPGYLSNINEFSSSPDKEESLVPSALHFYELVSLKRALELAGFILEFSEYLDGRTNGAHESTWHSSGKEYIGIIAIKP